eukprot:1833211-Karenia_brevis.AAC.2
MRWKRKSHPQNRVVSQPFQHDKQVEAMFEEDVKPGHMRKVVNSQALKDFGFDQTTPAIAALQKNDDSFWTVHDGTHRVHTSPQIIVRDQVAYPAI